MSRRVIDPIMDRKAVQRPKGYNRSGLLTAMTLSEFRRTIQPGDFVTMTANTLVPNLPFIGKRRCVSRITPTYLILKFEEQGDVFDFHTPLPKAQDFECDEEGFSFTMHSSHTGRPHRVSYKWERSRYFRIISTSSTCASANLR